MSNAMKYMICLLALPFLVACATLDENECRVGDWRTIGEADGANGRTPDHLLRHAKACNKYQIAPNRAEWEEGRQLGLPRYCTPRRAYREGARGSRLSPVCPPEDLAVLERENRRGLNYHRVDQDIAEANREINRINRTLEKLEVDDPVRASLISERAALRLDILSLRAERSIYRY